MGNSCAASCNNSSVDKNAELGQQETPRMGKPEHLPSLSFAVKSQTKIIQRERDIQLNEQQCPFSGGQQQQNIKERLLQSPNAKLTDMKILQPVQQQQNQQIPSEQLKSSQVNQIQQISRREEEKQMNTLYEKIGEAEGIKILVEKMASKMLVDPDLKNRIEKIDQDVWKEKLRQYFTYRTGGSNYWIGKSMSEAHQKHNISNKLFDTYVDYIVKSLQEMRVKHDCLREMVKVFQGLREEIVCQKPIVEQQQSTYDRMGGMDSIKKISEILFDKLYQDDHLKQYFQRSNREMMIKKFSYFLSQITNGPYEWIGKSLRDAHQGKGITENQFLQFGVYLLQAMEEINVERETQNTILEAVNAIKNEVIQQPPMTLFEKLDQIEGGFQGMMYKYLSVVVQDPVLGKYFVNVRSVDTLASRFVVYFACRAGFNYSLNGGPTLKEIHMGKGITEKDFQQALDFFKVNLDEMPIDQQTKNETIELFKTLQQDIVDSEEKKTLYDKIGGIEVIKKVAEKMYEKIYVDPDMNQYYLKTEKSKIKKKFAFFIANITGGPYEWPGKSLREAHQGRHIYQRHFMKIIEHMQSSMEECGIPQSIQNIIIDQAKIAMPDIIEEEDKQQQLPIQQKQDNRNQSGEEEEEVKINLRLLSQPNISDQNDSCRNVQPQIIVSDLNDHSHSPIKTNNDQPQKTIQEQLQEKEESIEVKELQQELVQVEEQETGSIKIEKSPSEVIQEVSSPKQESLNSFNHQRPSLKIEVQQDLPIINNGKSIPNSPQKKNNHIREFRFILSDLLGDILPLNAKINSVSINNTTVFKGELQRLMHKQKTILYRWLVLNQQALFIYKDQVSCQGFPMKPLYVIPLTEIVNVQSKEITLNHIKHKNKNFPSIEIHLSQKYGLIAESIAQLVSIYAMNKNDKTLASPLKEKNNKIAQQKDYSQNHSNDDTVLIFVSDNKRTIQSWIGQIITQKKKFEQNLHLDHFTEATNEMINAGTNNDQIINV